MPYRYLLIIPLIFICRAMYYQKRVAFLLNFQKLYSKYIEEYIEHHEKKDNEKKYNKLCEVILRKQEYVKKYIIESKVDNPHISNAKPLGLGFVDTSGISVLDNIGYLGDSRIVDAFKQCLNRSIGYYEHARNENFNPVFWGEYLILKAPKSLLNSIIDIIKKAIKPS